MTTAAKRVSTRVNTLALARVPDQRVDDRVTYLDDIFIQSYLIYPDLAFTLDAFVIQSCFCRWDRNYRAPLGFDCDQVIYHTASR